MQEVLPRRAELRVPLHAREAARMRHKRNRAREIGMAMLAEEERRMISKRRLSLGLPPQCRSLDPHA